MLKLNDNSTTLKENDIEKLKNPLVSESKQIKKKELEGKHNDASDKPPLKSSDNNKSESEELKKKLQESYKFIKKLKEKLIISEQKYENKLIREQEKFFNAEKKISQLEFELVNSRLNKSKNNENNEKINENTISSLTAPMSLSPPTLSKVNPSSHITSFNLKPPLPSNLYKSQSSGLLSNANPSTSLRSIKSANSSPSSLQFDNNLNDPSNIFNPTSSFNTNPTSTNSTTTSTSTTSFLQKKQFNGTTATIHYLELKLNEKDKEMAVMKDNYEKTLKNLRSNLSKVKMESAIEIFELKNKVKELENQIFNDNELLSSSSNSSNIIDRNYLLNHEIDGRKSSLSLSSSSSSDDDNQDHHELGSGLEKSSDILNELRKENNNELDMNDNDNTKSENNQQEETNTPLIPRPPSQNLSNNVNDNTDHHSSSNDSNSIKKTISVTNLTSSKTKILKNNNNIRTPSSQLLPSPSSLSLPSDLNDKELCSKNHYSIKRNYDLQIQKYKAKIKNLQDQLATKNHLILDLSLQLSPN